MQDDSKYLATADVMRLVKPTYVGRRVRGDHTDPSDALFRAQVRRDTLIAAGVAMPSHAADEDNS